MTFPSAPQPTNNYLLGKRFSLPIGSHTYDAVAISSSWSSKLTSLNTLLVGTVILNIWCILFASALILLLRRGHAHPLSTALWNKRGSMTNTFWEVLPGIYSQWKNWRAYPFILVLAGFWAAQVAVSLYIPSLVFIDNAAPVNPYSVHAPVFNQSDNQMIILGFMTNAPAAIRALGSSLVASQDTMSRITTTYSSLPSLGEQQPMAQFDYSYHITGADLGLQQYPDLRLDVNGSCRTEYGWLDKSGLSSYTVQILDTKPPSNRSFTQDTYAWFGNFNNTEDITQRSIYWNGPSPVASFAIGEVVSDTNITWAMIYSSNGRASWSEGTDPVYFTQQNLGETGEAGDFIIATGRPALSCWENDEWSYRGHSTGIAGLNSTSLPGLELPPSLQQILYQYLEGPKIVQMGKSLGVSALASAQGNTLGYTVDAASSSISNDLNRLVLAAYIATANTLTDTTLISLKYAENKLTDLARDENNKTLDGVGDFVIWSDDVSTLSVTALILIPVLSTAFVLIYFCVMTWTPLRRVRALEAEVLHTTLQKRFPEARPFKDGSWTTERVLVDEANAPFQRMDSHLETELHSLSELTPLDSYQCPPEQSGTTPVNTRRPALPSSKSSRWSFGKIGDLKWGSSKSRVSSQTTLLDRPSP